MLGLPGAPHCFGDGPGVIDVVILDQDHIIQANAMVQTAPPGHRQFVQRSQAGGGLARIEDDCTGPGDCIHELARQGGDPRHASHEVEGGPFGG